MKVRHLSIRHFRGIRELDWSIPEHRLCCLIGRGDSTKSTILEAMRRAFHPQWNLAFDDADFHQCDTSAPISIEVILGALPEEFLDLARYGLWLSGWNPSTCSWATDPGEGLEDVLRIKLHVADDLEPSWLVIKDGDNGVPFKPNDRAKVAVSLIGTLSDRHLTWSRGSLLSQLTDAETLSASLANASRAAKAALDARRADDLTQFDAVAANAERTSRILGVGVQSHYKAHLDTDALNVRIGGLALHDGELPLRQLGLGSKRMLTTGLQKEALNTPHITLFDEVEIGLEPHRIARLLHHLKQDDRGQYFLTSHSPVVIRELTVDDLHIVHVHSGKTTVVTANLPSIADSVQGKIRTGAEAFLAPKIVVCEGATEVGFLRGLEEHWIAEGKDSFAYQGIALYDANGASKIKGIAEDLAALSYDVGVLADSDELTQFSRTDADQLAKLGITVAMWSKDVSIEERVFADLPWKAVKDSFDVARSIANDDERLLNNVASKYGPGFNRDFSSWTDDETIRTALGKAAKSSDWFKRQDWARQWAEAISTYLNLPEMRDKDLTNKLALLRTWIDRG